MELHDYRSDVIDQHKIEKSWTVLTFTRATLENIRVFLSGPHKKTEISVDLIKQVRVFT